MDADAQTRRNRISPADGQEPVLPFVPAESLTRCELYWLPSTFPARQAERAWMLRFIPELIRRLSPTGELSAELFLEATALQPHLQDAFIQNALDFNPILGMSRAPGAALPTNLDMDYIEAVRTEKAKFDLNRFVSGYSYYLLRKELTKQLNLFWGHGGMTMMLVKSDPATVAPPLRIPSGVKKHPVYQEMARTQDIEGKLAMAYSLMAPFLKKSKETFGKGWEDRVEYRGLLYVLPRWSSRDYFTLPEEDVKGLFEVCEVLVTERPADGGVLLASGKPVRRIIHEVCNQLREENMIYPVQS